MQTRRHFLSGSMLLDSGLLDSCIFLSAAFALLGFKVVVDFCEVCRNFSGDFRDKVFETCKLWTRKWKKKTQSILRGEPILREVRNQCSCLQTCSERTGQLVPPQHIGWSISCRTYKTSLLQICSGLRKSHSHLSRRY